MITKNNILILKPHFENKIWGGNKLHKLGFECDENHVGEAWIISCLKNKSSWISNENCFLYDFYNDKNNAWFFNNYNLNHSYPLLTKIIDANENLSVQLHPDDLYVKNNIDKSLNGKTECWYILDTKINNCLIYGHNAKTKEEFIQALKNNSIEKLLNYLPIKKNDFIYVPSKKIHAILKDTLIFELQQSSDLTYRIYDYNRLENNKPRELHIKESIDLLSFPDFNISQNEISKDKDFLVNNDFFKLKKIINLKEKTYLFKDANWLQITILKNDCEINGIKLNQYDSILVACNCKLSIKGNCEILLSYV